MKDELILQQISTLCDNLPSAMKEEKERQRKTNQQIADSTGLSISTVNKFFAGSLSNPGIFSVAPIAIDLGMSLDSLMGIQEAPQGDGDEIRHLELEIAHKDELLQKTEEQVSLLQERSRMMGQEIIAVRNSWRSVTYSMAGLAILFGCFLMVYVLLDVANPDIGLFQGSKLSPIVYFAAFSIVSALLYVGHTMVKKRMERKANAKHPH